MNVDEMRARGFLTAAEPAGLRQLKDAAAEARAIIRSHDTDTTKLGQLLAIPVVTYQPTDAELRRGAAGPITVARAAYAQGLTDFHTAQAFVDALREAGWTH